MEKFLTIDIEGHKRDSYDREIISTLMKKYYVGCHTECLVDIYDEYPSFYMNPTHSQKGQRTENQIWMNNAIRHNLEDSKMLWEAIRNIKQPYRPITL